MAIDYNMRYRALKAVIEHGDLQTFEGVFKFVSMTRLSTDAKIKLQRMKAIRALPGLASVPECMQMCKVIDVELAKFGPLMIKAHITALQ